MYTIIGGDGKEYGPVTADQVRSWIAGGRANLRTRIKAAGGDEWRTIADFPEITEEGAPPVAGAPAYAGPAAKLDIISCYERSWDLLKANFWPLLGANLLILAIYAALGYAQTVGTFVASPLFGGVLQAGLYHFYLRRIRAQPTTIGDLFAGFTKAFLTLLVAGLVVTLFMIAGFFCLVIPGIYLVVAYAFTYILAIDKGLGFWEAMETSRKVITRQWWRVLGLLLLGVLFMLLGIAALGVGVFVAIPLITGAIAYAYEDLCNPQK